MGVGKSIRLFGLVAIGAALVAIVSTEFVKASSLPLPGDPARLAAQVISTLGFIGTGLIWMGKDRQIYGIPEAAALWVTAIVGILIGAGFFKTAAMFMTLATIYLVFNFTINLYKRNSGKSRS